MSRDPKTISPRLRPKNMSGASNAFLSSEGPASHRAFHLLVLLEDLPKVEIAPQLARLRRLRTCLRPEQLLRTPDASSIAGQPSLLW